VNRSLSCALALFFVALASRVSADGAGPASEPPRTEPLRISGAVTTDGAQGERLLIPPYMRERRGDVTTTALFPLYFDRRDSQGVERFVLPYYYKRRPKEQADVALGLIWSLRGPNRHTFVLPPLYTHRRDKDWAFGLAPLLATGHKGGHYHTVIPPLLTWIDGDEKSHRWLVGPLYDVQTQRARWRGLFPLLWSKQDDHEGFQVVPPLFWRFTESDPASATTVVPPFYYTRNDKERNWGLVPLLFRKKSDELRSTTIPLALFHHARGPSEFRLVTPLLAYLNDKREGSLWVTPIYQRRRGDRNFDAVLPLFIRTWDERDASRGLYLPPIYWHREDPANRSTVVFPFFASRERDGISDFWMTPLFAHHRQQEKQQDTWWVAPTFHYSKSPTSYQFNIHPLFYVGRSEEKRHLAFAPLYFDFENYKKKTRSFVLAPFYFAFRDQKELKNNRVVFPIYWDLEHGKRKRRHVVGFPLYWDFDYRDRAARYTVAFPFYARSKVQERTRHFSLNTMYETSSGKEGRWQFHFFPLFARGGSARDRWWSVLYGLAGYDRRGPHRRVQAFWIPFDLGK
jgi:hypothetical protein